MEEDEDREGGFMGLQVTLPARASSQGASEFDLEYNNNFQKWPP